MTTALHPLDEVLRRLERGEPFGLADAALIQGSSDLVRIGILGDQARRRITGDRVTFCRVAEIRRGDGSIACGLARDIRIVGAPLSKAEALQVTAFARRLAGDMPVTGFELSDLVALSQKEGVDLVSVATALKSAGLDAVAAVRLDAFDDPGRLSDAVSIVRAGGLAAKRLVVDTAAGDARLSLIRRAADLQAAVGGFEAFAPLPRLDPADQPGTGYDDVKTVAVARLLCHQIPLIQMDWPLYGPKLAQVALTFGANDVDGIAAVDDPALGARRAAGEDIARQIRAASGSPAERDGLYRVRE